MLCALLLAPLGHSGTELALEWMVPMDVQEYRFKASDLPLTVRFVWGDHDGTVTRSPNGPMSCPLVSPAHA